MNLEERVQSVVERVSKNPHLRRSLSKSKPVFIKIETPPSETRKRGQASNQDALSRSRPLSFDDEEHGFQGQLQLKIEDLKAIEEASTRRLKAQDKDICTLASSNATLKDECDKARKQLVDLGKEVGSKAEQQRQARETQKAHSSLTTSMERLIREQSKHHDTIQKLLLSQNRSPIH